MKFLICPFVKLCHLSYSLILISVWFSTPIISISLRSLCPFLLCPSPSIYTAPLILLHMLHPVFFHYLYWVHELNLNNVETLCLIGCPISENTRALIKKHNLATHYWTEMGRKIGCNHLCVCHFVCAHFFLCIRIIILLISFTCMCMCVICLCLDLLMRYFQELCFNY